MTESPLAAEATDALRRLVGDPTAEFRDGQLEAITALVADRRRALVVQRTGWGKSAVYFVTTALLRARGAGPTLLVSPLLGLMRNQIQAAERGGLRAATINSDNQKVWNEVIAELEANTIDCLLVSPERFANQAFRERVLPSVAPRGSARHRRGALHQRLGSRLPTRLPPASRASSISCRGACPCSGRRRPRTTGSSPTCRRSSARSC